MFGTKKELLEIKTELDKIKNQLIIPKSNSEEISENEKALPRVRKADSRRFRFL